MFLKSTGFKFFAKIMGGNYVFCCSSHISFNPTSHLKQTCNFQLQVCLSMYVILLPLGMKELKIIANCFNGFLELN